MSTIALHAPPAWISILREQIRLTGGRMRHVLLGFTGLFLVFDVIVAAAATRFTHGNANGIRLGFVAEESGILVAIVLLLTLMLFFDEDPSRRLYHWMMPMERTRHALTRSLAGWVWAMVMTIVFMINILLISLIVSRIEGLPYPADAHTRAWHYLIPFMAATVAYVFGAAAAVGARRPLVWLGGGPLLISLLAGVALRYGFPSIAIKLAALLSGAYGLFTAFGYNLLSTPANGTASVRWATASVIWMIVALGVLHATARIRHEIRP